MMEKQLKGELSKISKVQEKRQEELLQKQNVVGVALGHKMKAGRDLGDNCLTVFVEHKLDKDLIPKDSLIAPEIDKYKTDVVETGVIFAGTELMKQPAKKAQEEAGILTLKRRMRPAEGGVSVGHFAITAGTIATAVYDREPFPGIPRRYYILSNNHVLANSNNANIGDAILQPGPFDGGVLPSDLIAHLSRFVPIRFDGSCNFVDAAIAEGQFHDLDREVYWIGYVKGLASAEIGMLVQKNRANHQLYHRQGDKHQCYGQRELWRWTSGDHVPPNHHLKHVGGRRFRQPASRYGRKCGGPVVCRFNADNHP
jgi:hypothetical protein